MSTENNPNNKADKTARAGVVKIAAIVTATTMLIGASFGVQAVAESKMYQHAKLYVSDTTAGEDQSYFQKASWGKRHKGRHMRLAEMCDAEIEKKITRAVKHVSIEIDATAEQEQKITALVTALAKDMKPLHGEFKAAGEQLHKLLVADKIDRVAIERIRAERIAEADRVSKELTTAIADVAEILSPEQREVLNERIEQFKSMRGRWHRG